MLRQFVCLLSLALLAASACSGSQSTTGLGGVDADRAAINPLFAELFVEDQVFHYVGETLVTYWDDEDPDADETGTVSSERRWTFVCRVVDARSFANSVASRIECDGEDRDLIAGSYSVDAVGLWRLSSLPSSEDEVASLREGTPILAAQPVERSDAVQDEWGGSSIAVAQASDGSWCATESFWGGDESSASICLQAGRGIISAEHSWSGGAHEETSLWLSDE